MKVYTKTYPFHINIATYSQYKYENSQYFAYVLPSSSMHVSVSRTSRSLDPTITTKNRRFTYSEVVKMTNNFEKILGKGGFGMVYHGTVNDAEQVAVKMLSPSSSQGYKEFKAEVLYTTILDYKFVEKSMFNKM